MNPPAATRRLFKYRPLLTCHGKVHPWTESIFRARELWFAAPKDFNDPFDCNLRLEVKGSDKEKHALLLKICQDGGPAEVSCDSLEEIESALSGKTPWKDFPKIFSDAQDEQCREIYEESSAFCWSAIGNSVSMFSYYADSHRGICLEFEVSPEDEIGGVKPIIYSADLPELNYVKLRGHPDRLAESLVFTKSLSWSHEQEWRVFRHKESYGPVGFQDHHLKRIILGCAGSDKDRLRRKEVVTNLLADWRTPVMLAQAETSKGSFKLEIQDLCMVQG